MESSEPKRRPQIDAYIKQAAEAFEQKNEDRGRWCIIQVETTVIGIANCVEHGLAWDVRPGREETVSVRITRNLNRPRFRMARGSFPGAKRLPREWL